MKVSGRVAPLGRLRSIVGARFVVKRVGGRGIDELWAPTEDLDEFNRHIVGPIELVAEYR